jgi:hypothetical protein
MTNHPKLTPDQHEQIRNDLIKAMAGVRHVSVAPRQVSKSDMLEFRIANLEAIVHAQARTISRLMADRQGGE